MKNSRYTSSQRIKCAKKKRRKENLCVFWPNSINVFQIFLLQRKSSGAWGSWTWGKNEPILFLLARKSENIFLIIRLYAQIPRPSGSIFFFMSRNAQNWMYLKKYTFKDLQKCSRLFKNSISASLYTTSLYICYSFFNS